MFLNTKNNSYFSIWIAQGFWVLIYIFHVLFNYEFMVFVQDYQDSNFSHVLNFLISKTQSKLPLIIDIHVRTIYINDLCYVFLNVGRYTQFCQKNLYFLFQVILIPCSSLFYRLYKIHYLSCQADQEDAWPPN